MTTRVLLSLLFVGPAQSFVPSSSSTFVSQPHRQPQSPSPPSTTSSISNLVDTQSQIRRHISSSSPTGHHARTTPTQLQSFFGLGPAEIAIVLVASLVVVGPAKIAEWSKEAGSAAGQAGSQFGEEWQDLKKIPEEFSKGVEEGETNIRSRKAKEMDKLEEGDE